jgi:hypothetical protein
LWGASHIFLLQLLQDPAIQQSQGILMSPEKYARKIADGSFTAPKGKPTPKQKFRYIKWPGMNIVKVALKRK